jgi:hypothetical protein
MQLDFTGRAAGQHFGSQPQRRRRNECRLMPGWLYE